MTTSFLSTLLNNLLFSIIVECIVFMGIVATRIMVVPHKKIKIIFMSLLISFFVFFNLAFMIDVFGINFSDFLIVVMAACFALGAVFIIILLRKCFDKKEKSSLTLLLILVLSGGSFYFTEQVIGFHHTPFVDVMESLFILSILIVLYRVIVSSFPRKGFAAQNHEIHRKIGKKKK